MPARDDEHASARALGLEGADSAEWHTRCELAALYRLAAHFRMTDLIDTHISARLPGQSGQFLINRYGVLFHEMRASDLVKVDEEGRALQVGRDATAGQRVNKAGFTIHSAVHQARPDLHFVIHTHTSAGIAVAAQQAGLLPISQHALKFYGKLGYHDYEGIALDLAERERLVAALGGHKALILRNHGLLAAGATAAEAFHEIYFLERACQAQVAALAGGQPLNLPPEAVRLRTAAQFDNDNASGIIDLAWQSALRLIQEEGSGYRC
ncbi:class II aldolase/adducin family protein [Herbaspirillum sp. alder98]|uniref:class II aldolase/adducin family protein n=1 Tax=Herbaspirillum sp. alder98 TaxID=2913096 RepID=UPI001CD8FEC7|nr:class II aldolase/adducin family protein [Herbaspirillum sp. alder98]MCA1325425.1 class II aldolase/adducin family protein [Herbaspirillum sp. alder98]